MTIHLTLQGRKRSLNLMPNLADSDAKYTLPTLK
jgi:hypothetical protein